MLAGIGHVTAKKLKHFGLVTMIGHIVWFYNRDIKTLAEVKSLSVGLLKATRVHARTATTGKYEGFVISHTKSKNPYKSLYRDH